MAELSPAMDGWYVVKLNPDWTHELAEETRYAAGNQASARASELGDYHYPKRWDGAAWADIEPTPDYDGLRRVYASWRREEAVFIKGRGKERWKGLADALRLLSAARSEGPGVAQAYHDGFMAALGCAPWEDASDFAILVGMDYAVGKPPPSTMPTPVLPGHPFHPAGDAPSQTVQMLLFCPSCGKQHVDEPTEDWPNPPHRSHLCLGCGHIWRPADVPTEGVASISTRGQYDSPHPAGDAPSQTDAYEALRAMAEAERLDDEWQELCERADAEGWDAETGGSHLNDAYKPVAAAYARARELREAALSQPSQTSGEDVEQVWWPITSAPKGSPGLHIAVRSTAVYRWLAYKPDGARQMKKPGRWQVMGHDLGGWANAELPEGAEWSALPQSSSAERQPTPIQESGQ